MLPVISEKAEEKEDVPKLLCVLGYLKIIYIFFYLL